MTADQEGAFTTHANYIRAFATLAGYTLLPMVTPAVALSRLKATVLRSPSLGASVAGRPDMTALRRSLANAWGTELILALTREFSTEDELVRVTNNWAVVQAYYVTYHAIQGLRLAAGQPRPQSHPATQRVFADTWVTRHLQIPPWTFGVGEGGNINLPPGRVIDQNVHPWSSCDRDSCWDIGAKALRSTREDAISEALKRKRKDKQSASRKAWEKEEGERLARGKRPRRRPTFSLPLLTPAEKASIRAGVRVHTFMDYLYRLRIKGNYEDATMFTDGPTDEVSSARVHRDLVRLASTTMFLHEMHIRQLVGQAAMTRLVDAWLTRNSPPGLRVGLIQRRDLLTSP